MFFGPSGAVGVRVTDIKAFVGVVVDELVPKDGVPRITCVGFDDENVTPLERSVPLSSTELVLERPRRGATAGRTMFIWLRVGTCMSMPVVESPGCTCTVCAAGSVGELG